MNKLIPLACSIIVMIFMCVVCASIGIIFTSAGVMEGFSEALDEEFADMYVIKDELLDDVCYSHGDFTEAEYEEWFDETYTLTNTYNDAKEAVSTALPDDLDCVEFFSSPILGAIDETKQEIFSGTDSTDGTYRFGTFSYKTSDGVLHTISVNNKSGEWKISYID